MGSACDKTSPSTALLTQAANKTWKQSSFDHNTLFCCSTTAVSQTAACVPTLKSTVYLLCFSPTRSLSPLKNVVRRIKRKASSSSSPSVRSVPATAGQSLVKERKYRTTQLAFGLVCSPDHLPLLFLSQRHHIHQELALQDLMSTLKSQKIAPIYPKDSIHRDYIKPIKSQCPMNIIMKLLLLHWDGYILFLGPPWFLQIPLHFKAAAAVVAAVVFACHFSCFSSQLGLDLATASIS